MAVIAPETSVTFGTRRPEENTAGLDDDANTSTFPLSRWTGLDPLARLDSATPIAEPAHGASGCLCGVTTCRRRVARTESRFSHEWGNRTAKDAS